MTLEQAFEQVLSMARAEFNRNARQASLGTADALQGLELVTAFYYLNVKGN